MELIIFPPALNCPSASPYSMKAELLLRMAKVDYKAVRGSNPGKGPNGKLPYLIDDGKEIADSYFIYQHIKQKFNVDLDGHLTGQQLATSLAFTRLCEDHLYWCNVYARWVDPEFNHHVEVFFKPIPWGIRQIVTKKSRKSATSAVYHHGIGRHSKEKIYQLGCDDISAIAAQLGEDEFFLGDRVSSVDAIIYGVLASVIYPDIDTPMRVFAKEFENIRAYLGRIEDEFDYAPPLK
ncbi:MAG: glutathione S-transferase family protein [Alphaproteobacteria bacterium]|nr:glutathione S-transferase family protein [Alphaproteobacteria bacterium]